MRFSAAALSLLLACTSSSQDVPGGGGRDGGSTADGARQSDGGSAVPEESRVARYLRSSSAQSLVLEIDSVPGFEPRDAARDELIAELAGILDKPEGIEAVADGALSPRGSDFAWTDQALAELAAENFDLQVPETAIKMHVLFVDGHSARDSDSGVILGLAWANTHLVMFKETIENACAGALTPPIFREPVCVATERSIWLHETGHVLGLVNNGIPMVNDHQDVEHGAHDIDDSCVMYWEYEGSAAVDVLRDSIVGGGSGELGFDDECLADIAAVRDPASPSP